MREIRIYSLFSLHEIYRDLLLYPPKGVIYSQKIEPEVKRFSRTLKISRLGNILSKVGLPRIAYLPKASDYDLIHSTRGILIVNKKPWIIDLEHAVTITNQNFRTIKNPLVKKIIEKFFSSTYCKKIMPHTYAAKKTLFHYLDCSKFKDKIEVVYPAIKSLPVKKKWKEKDKITLLFVGKWFYWKGGKEVLEAFDILNKKYDIQLIMKCETVPKEYLEKYKNYPNVKFITSFIPRKELNSLYLNSDIFVFPTYWDSFGIVMLEAMNFYLPIVTTDFFACPEIVEDGKNGFVVKIPKYLYNFLYLKSDKPEIVKQIVKYVSILIENKSLRKEMGNFGKNLIRVGKFSIKERNKKLKTFYQKAI